MWEDRQKEVWEKEKELKFGKFTYFMMKNKKNKNVKRIVRKDKFLSVLKKI